MVVNASFASVNASNNIHANGGIWARSVSLMTEDGYKSLDEIIEAKMAAVSAKVAELEAIKESVDKAMAALESMASSGPVVGPAGPPGPPGPQGPVGKQGNTGLRGPGVKDLASIKDVSAENVKDGYALVWSDKSKKWEAKAIFE